MTQTLEQNFTETELIRSITKDDFFEFVREFWETIEARQPVWNWHIKYMCQELQIVAERVFNGEPKEYDLIINIPPGTTKSTVASVMFPAWVWTKMAEAQFVTASYRHELAMDLSRKSRDIITSEKYRETFPEVTLRTDQKVKTHFMNTMGGFRVATGSGGAVGFHGHFIIVDDPIDPKDISEVTLKSTNIWMDETLSQRMVDRNITPIILIMQRLHQDDPTAHMIKITPTDRIKHICLPAEDTGEIKPPELRRYYKDGLLEPTRFPRKVLEQERLKGDYFYSGQFMQNPIPRGGAMFKTEKIEIMDSVPVDMKFKKVVRFWDYAGTKDAGAYTCGVKLGKTSKGKIWILDVVRGRWDSGTREGVIKQTAQLDGKVPIIGLEQEPGSAGKFQVESTAKNLSGWRVRPERPTGDKITRADPFASQVNVGNVCMLKGEWNRDYINEMQYFPMSTYKDQIDATSGAFQLLDKKELYIGVIGAYGR